MENELAFFEARKPKKSTSGPFKASKPVAAPNEFGIGDVGIEIEVEGVSLPNHGTLDGVRVGKAQWDVKQDGSLRGGLEYVTTGAVPIDAAEELVKGLYEKGFNRDRCRLNLSNRCSTHVHVNVGGLKAGYLTSIIALWYIFEDVIIEGWCGEHRKANHFCLSASDVAAGTLEAWVGFLERGNFPMQGNNDLKYSALNLIPLWSFGSIEFRAMGATDDYKEVVTWCRFLNGLVKYSLANFENPQSITYACSERGPRDILHEICETAGLKDEEFFDIVTGVDDFDLKCIQGVRNTQPLTVGVPWEDWMEELRKEYVVDPFAAAAPLIPLRGRARRGAFDDMPMIADEDPDF